MSNTYKCYRDHFGEYAPMDLGLHICQHFKFCELNALSRSNRYWYNCVTFTLPELYRREVGTKSPEKCILEYFPEGNTSFTLKKFLKSGFLFAYLKQYSSADVIENILSQFSSLQRQYLLVFSAEASQRAQQSMTMLEAGLVNNESCWNYCNRVIFAIELMHYSDEAVDCMKFLECVALSGNGIDVLEVLEKVLEKRSDLTENQQLKIVKLLEQCEDKQSAGYKKFFMEDLNGLIKHHFNDEALSELVLERLSVLLNKCENWRL